MPLPWIDLTCSGESWQTNAKADLIVEGTNLCSCAPLYLHGTDPRNPLASPIFADLHGLPPICIQVGSDEVLLSDATQFSQLAEAAGVEMRLEVWQDMQHLWQLATRYLPESRPDFNLRRALEGHWTALMHRADRLNRLIETVNQTIAEIKGEVIMTDKEYFEGFDESQYEEEVRQRWGSTPQYAESQKKWASYSREQKEAIKVEGGQITIRMVSEDPHASPDDPDVQAAIREYHAYINKYFYTCDIEFMRNLADMWVEDPRFAINYDRIREGGAAFVREAVHIFCDRNK
jgi:MerR family transcriptional regulator, thiopeptide resistance regulator